MGNPLGELTFPVYCRTCKAGPFFDGDQVDEHITEDHLAEAVWDFAHDNMIASDLPRCKHCGHPAESHDDEFGHCTHFGVTDTLHSKCECPGYEEAEIANPVN